MSKGCFWCRRRCGIRCSIRGALTNSTQELQIPLFRNFKSSKREKPLYYGSDCEHFVEKTPFIFVVAFNGEIIFYGAYGGPS